MRGFVVVRLAYARTPTSLQNVARMACCVVGTAATSGRSLFLTGHPMEIAFEAVPVFGSRHARAKSTVRLAFPPRCLAPIMTSRRNFSRSFGQSKMPHMTSDQNLFDAGLLVRVLANCSRHSRCRSGLLFKNARKSFLAR